jgi:hypothetical protein
MLSWFSLQALWILIFVHLTSLSLIVDLIEEIRLGKENISLESMVFSYSKCILDREKNLVSSFSATILLKPIMVVVNLLVVKGTTLFYLYSFPFYLAYS